MKENHIEFQGPIDWVLEKVTCVEGTVSILAYKFSTELSTERAKELVESITKAIKGDKIE